MARVQRSEPSLSDTGLFSEVLSNETELAAPPRLEIDNNDILPMRGVRWYWHKPAFTPKGQAVAADMPHRAQIQRFCDADSNALEESFRERKDEIESAWWREHSELAEGPKRPGKSTSPTADGVGGSLGSIAPAPALHAAGKPDGGSMSKTVVDVAARRKDLLEKETSATSWEEFKAQGQSVSQIGVLVRGKRWEVDLLLRLMTPCYWPEAQHRVMRGTWFVEKGLDWVPLAETVADELETAFRRGVWRPELRHLAQQKQGFIAARINLATPAIKGTYALFVSAEEAYLCVDDTYTWVSRKMGNAAKGSALRRGYTQPHAGSLECDFKAEEADNNAAVAPVDRLLLAVHGIGQKLSRASIVDDATAMRSLVLSAANDPELHAMAGGSGGRIELLPVQWRKGLTLGVDSLAERLMPANLEALRGILHATAVEVLLYLTPLHCQDMVNSVVLSLNATYAKFIARNPSFTGKVSIVAHSLGSVLAWDILSCQPRWYAALPSHRTSHGAVDTSLAALERLSHRGKVHSSSSGDPSVPSDNNSATRSAVTRGGATEVPPTKHRPDVTPSAPPAVQGGLAIQPLCSEDLEPSTKSPHSSSGCAKEAPATLPMASYGAAMRISHDHAAPHDMAPTAGAASANRQLPADAGDAPSPTSQAQASREIEALRQEVKELRTQLRASAGKSDDRLWRQPSMQAVNESMTTEEAAQLQPSVLVSSLDFPVDQLICIGSPNGLFLALRKVDPGQGRGLGTPAAAKLMPGGGGGCDGLPAVNRAYNLYHPYDPIAYRMEPLAVIGGEKRRPVFADYHRGGRRIHIGLQEMGEDVGSAVSGFGAAAGRMTGSVWDGLRKGVGRAVHLGKVADALATDQGDAAGTSSEAGHQTVDAEVLARTPGNAYWRLCGGRDTGDSRVATADGRMDFVLQESPTENQYLSAISSHFSYWHSPDTALLLARAVSGLDVLTGRPAAAILPEASQSTQSPNDATKKGGVLGTSPRTPVAGVPAMILSPEELLDRGWH